MSLIGDSSDNLNFLLILNVISSKKKKDFFLAPTEKTSIGLYILQHFLRILGNK